MNLAESWICDVCSEPILGVEDGWVQWLVKGSPPKVGRDLQLVHVRDASPLTGSETGCQFNAREEFLTTGFTKQDLHLRSFVGPDGLMMLIRFIHEGILPTEEVLELMKRLHIPGYEQARPYFDEAISAYAFDPNTPPGYYYQYQIEETLRYVQERYASL